MTRLRRSGPLSVRYDAIIDIAHYIASPDSVGEGPIAQLPAEVLAYIPSRY